MEELETLESTECPECPGPPPEFRLPPPPRPPFLTEGTYCSETPLTELEDCIAVPMIDASYHTNPSLQSTALIITCAVVLLLMAAIVSVVFWKHKRKVQNLLPCKSAAGAAAAAAAAGGAGAPGRGRVLPDGEAHTGSAGGVVGSGVPGTGAAVLYEDLPDAAVTHSQLHNHLPSHHPGQAPTIEVRGTNPEHRLREQPQLLPQAQRTARAPPAPHHLDYLDYRDPRAILRVTDKPSRAVLGGYRTPRALLAKSQGVPLSIATHAPRGANASLPSPLSQNGTQAMRNSHLLLATQNALITSQQPLPTSPISPSITPPIPLSAALREAENAAGESCAILPRVSGPITPTHRALKASPVTTPSRASPQRSANGTPVKRVPPAVIVKDDLAPRTGRRPSVDSEGYSYIDFKDADLESTRCQEAYESYRPTQALRSSSQRLMRLSSRSSSIDSDGYSYIVDPGYRKAPGTARRIVSDGTEEEVCPLCTMQQIHHLLSRPEDVYLSVRDT